MTKNCVFTICAKNYLAQALTLKDSVIRHNPEIDFYLFLSDLADDDIPKEEIIELDKSWLPKWEEMAFKYNVIEFSTSIKPFCFKKLFSEGYNKVIYLDPDIYVVDNLDYIFTLLDTKSIVLSPHYCNIQTEYSGCVTEEELLFVGIYNLGFVAIINNETGNKIVSWWMNRLENKCYADYDDALHVDQKWIDFIPAFFPTEVCITHHMGINPAIWNLHERSLDVDDAGRFVVIDNNTKKSFPLIFFHFSGFDPFNPQLVNRRHPKYNSSIFPSFGTLAQEYIGSEYAHGYEKFSKMTYSFNQFKNGENILPLHRRIFREYIKSNISNHPFEVSDPFYTLLKGKKLLTHVKNADFNGGINFGIKEKGKRIEKFYQHFSIIFIRMFGIRRFFYLLKFFKKISRYENQYYLIEE